MPALPATWTTIASRERWPAVPKTKEERDNRRVQDLWVAVADAPLTQAEAHELALQGRVWLATHYDDTHAHFQVMIRRQSIRDLVRRFDFGEKPRC